jgi:predicted dienelactone hydrolase
MGYSGLPAFAVDSLTQYTPDDSTPGAYQISVIDYDWFDQKRRRRVPVRIYFPQGGSGPFPVIIFSHGLGGSREGYQYLGRHWASQGYVSVHLQHLGSDSAVWQKRWLPWLAMWRAARDPHNSINRPLDVSFVIDRLAVLNREDSSLKGRLDVARLGAAGHSFGAFTVLAVAGQVFTGTRGATFTLADPRIRAIIPMSAPVPRPKKRLARAYEQIRIPCLHMTGTRDHSPIGWTKAKERRLPFDSINGADQYLIVFKDGDHMVFSDHRRWRGGDQKIPRFHGLISQSSSVFWDAYLKEDPKARNWLAAGGFARALGDNGTFEKKLLHNQ